MSADVLQAARLLALHRTKAGRSRHSLSPSSGPPAKTAQCAALIAPYAL